MPERTRDINYNIRDDRPHGVLGQLPRVLRDSVMVAFGMIVVAAFALFQGSNKNVEEIKSLQQQLQGNVSTISALREQVRAQGTELSDLHGKLSTANELIATLQSSAHNVLGKELSVREAQAILLRQGYPVGKVDGIAGKSTWTALKRFQEDNGLNASGELDEATKARLVALRLR
jgi:hypothetical protein